MKIEIDIEKKHFLIILGTIVILASAAFVYSYAQSIPNPGHGADTVWVSVNNVEKTLQQAIDDGTLDQDTFAFTDTKCNVSGSCSQVCIGADCKTSWPSSVTTLTGTGCYCMNTRDFGGIMYCGAGYYAAGVCGGGVDGRHNGVYCCRP